MSYNDSEDKSLEKDKVVLETRLLKDVLNMKLEIPDYQRIYCWPQKNVELLLDDVFEPRNHEYHLVSNGLLLCFS